MHDDILNLKPKNTTYDGANVIKIEKAIEVVRKDFEEPDCCNNCIHYDCAVIFSPHNICIHPSLKKQSINDIYLKPNWCPLMVKIKENSWVHNAIGQTHTGAMLTGADEDDISQIKSIQEKEIAKPVKNVGQLINEYIAFRDELSDLRKTFKTAESIIKESMELIEAELLEIQRKLGLSSTSAGGLTAYQTPKVSIRMGDWDTFAAWLLKTKNFQCVEKRCAKLACLEIQDEFDTWNKANPDEPPKLLSDIGLDKQEEIAIQVRRTAGKK